MKRFELWGNWELVLWPPEHWELEKGQVLPAYDPHCYTPTMRWIQVGPIEIRWWTWRTA